jgi:hypothetical protein
MLKLAEADILPITAACNQKPAAKNDSYATKAEPCYDESQRLCN